MLFPLPSACYLCTYRNCALVRENSTSEPATASYFLVFSSVLFGVEPWNGALSNIIAAGWAKPCAKRSKLSSRANSPIPASASSVSPACTSPKMGAPQVLVDVDGDDDEADRS